MDHGGAKSANSHEISSVPLTSSSLLFSDRFSHSWDRQLLPLTDGPSCQICLPPLAGQQAQASRGGARTDAVLPGAAAMAMPFAQRDIEAGRRRAFGRQEGQAGALRGAPTLTRSEVFGDPPPPAQLRGRPPPQVSQLPSACSLFSFSDRSFTLDRSCFVSEMLV